MFSVTYLSLQCRNLPNHWHDVLPSSGNYWHPCQLIIKLSKFMALLTTWEAADNTQDCVLTCWEPMSCTSSGVNLKVEWYKVECFPAHPMSSWWSWTPPWLPVEQRLLLPCCSSGRSKPNHPNFHFLQVLIEFLFSGIFLPLTLSTPISRTRNGGTTMVCLLIYSISWSHSKIFSVHRGHCVFSTSWKGLHNYQLGEVGQNTVRRSTLCNVCRPSNILNI